MKRSPFPLLLPIVLALGALHAGAADLYLTPEGAGKKDGSGWQNALSQAEFAATVNGKMQPGDRLMLGGGNYANMSLKITAGGAAGKPKVIEGVDRGAGLPTFTSNWTIEQPDKGATAISFDPDVSYVSIVHLRIKNYCFGIHNLPAGDKPRTHLVFDDIDVEQARHPFYLADCDDLLIQNCDIKRYSKHGFRFDQGCDRVTVRKCTADCSEGDAVWETKTEIFPFGFSLNDGGTPNTEFLFEDCVTRNNLKSNQMKGGQPIRYTNGDGFVIEGNSRGVTFTRCRSLHNQDGGFDLKVADVKLTGCIATGNRRDYRIWTSGTLTNCFGGWSTVGLWSKSGAVTATRCTFHEERGMAAEAEDKATSAITLNDCLITSSTAATKPAKSMVNLKNTVVVTPGSPGKDPGYPKVDPKWDGTGNAMDSAAYPDKGYRSKP